MNRADAPLLVVVCGLSFAGKTTLGKGLARRFNYKEVDVDVTRVRLYGVRFEENELDQDAWNRIYDETDREIAHYLQSGTSVMDASRNFRNRSVPVRGGSPR
jgi:predicted kinase